MNLINKLLVFWRQPKRLKNAKRAANAQRLDSIGDATVGDGIE